MIRSSHREIHYLLFAVGMLSTAIGVIGLLFSIDLSVVEWSDLFAGLGVLVQALLVVAAFRGLSTWRNQLHGTYHYDLAKRLLKAVYELQEQISKARYVLMSSDEVPLGESDWEIAAYRQRWENVSNANIVLKSVALEVKAVSNDNYPSELNDLQRHVNELSLAVQAFTISKASSDLSEDVFRPEYRDVLYYSDDSIYGEKLRQTVASLEKKMQPHLRSMSL